MMTMDQLHLEKGGWMENVELDWKLGEVHHDFQCSSFIAEADFICVFTIYNNL